MRIIDPRICIHVSREELGILIWLCSDRIKRMEEQLARVDKRDFLTIDGLNRNINKYRDLCDRLIYAKPKFDEQDKILNQILEDIALENISRLDFENLNIDDVLAKLHIKEKEKYGNKDMG